MSKILPLPNKEIATFNKKQTKNYKEVCELLATEIASNLSTAESKIWHGSPVWFIDGNPVAGYDKLKDCVRLLFWSGQSFDEVGLQKTGSFKASEIRYTDVSQISKTNLKRWLKKAKDVQWDYKNIVKRKGKLIKLKI